MTLMFKVVASAVTEDNKFSLWLVSEPKSELMVPGCKAKMLSATPWCSNS
jgi:hypothetical protein